jgi:hypothetical protein
MFSIGADIEYFGKTKDGHHVAMCGKVGGTKEKPLQLAHLPKGYMVQEDNVSLEWNIPPAANRHDFTASIKLMNKEVAQIMENLGLEVSELSSFSFSKEELRHPKAMVFGCEPDWNAWTKRENERPCSENKALRTAGGHIHVGFDKMDMIAATRMMDLVLGVPSVILDDNDFARERRKLYGKAGAMRPKPYGIEYRSLSNFWAMSENLINWVYTVTRNSIKAPKALTIKEGEIIQNCINNGDKELATALVKQYKLVMP